mgnify:CR=1 FL=1
MPLVDSIDKIVDSYFSVVADEPFVYKKKQYARRSLTVRPTIFRGFTCPAKCGGCCPRFSLDYLPSELTPYKMSKRTVEFDGRSIEIYSDMQLDHNNHHCRNLNMSNGRCGVHGKQPFSCDFELIRSIKFDNPDRANRLTTKLFGRGWAMLRVDGERGALCEITPISEESVQDTIRKFKRLKEWCEHFGLKHRVDDIFDWANRPQARVRDLSFSTKPWSFARM